MGSEPPSSSVSRLMYFAEPSMILFPVPVSPVKAIFWIFGLSSISSPTVAPGPVTTFKTPGGRPALVTTSAIFKSVRGVVLAGFTTNVFPAASPGPSFHPMSETGKFQGSIAPTTPIGLFVTMK